jgi:pyruvate formate lyase activating enzyme
MVESLGPDVPWHFSAFHPDWKMRDIPQTPASTLRRARRIALEKGMRFVYVGNIHDEEADSTWCPGCGEKLIGRDWYEITSWNLGAGGSCRNCGEIIPGVFEDQPGSWGRKRVPVRLSAVGAN